jgi:hypothetical protein
VKSSMLRTAQWALLTAFALGAPVASAQDIVSFRTVAEGDAAGLPLYAGNIIANSLLDAQQTQIAQILDASALAQIDFSQRTLVAIFGGNFLGGGNAVRVVEVERRKLGSGYERVV